jgi:hypothetical protein
MYMGMTAAYGSNVFRWRSQAVSPAPPPVVEDFWTGVNGATTGWRAMEPREFSAV